MKVYKVTYQTFEVRHNFISSVGGVEWGIVNKEKFFGTEESALKFCANKNEAAVELGLYPTLSANYQEVELE